MKKFDVGRDYYGELGVSREASSKEISTRYRQLSRERHPDRTRDGGEAQRTLNEAYEVLHDSEVRAQYDAARSRIPRQQPPHEAPHQRWASRPRPQTVEEHQRNLKRAQEKVERVWFPYMDEAAQRVRSEGGFAAWGMAILTGVLAAGDFIVTASGYQDDTDRPTEE